MKNPRPDLLKELSDYLSRLRTRDRREWSSCSIEGAPTENAEKVLQALERIYRPDPDDRTVENPPKKARDDP